MSLEELRNTILNQAKYFLLNAGEFYPFGAAINKKSEIVPLGVQLENDHPKSHEVIEVLERVIISKLKDGEAKMAGIGTDVTYKPTEGTEKKSAIQVRILQSNGESIDYYQPYEKRGEDFFYEELFSEPGTLNFLRLV